MKVYILKIKFGWNIYRKSKKKNNFEKVCFLLRKTNIFEKQLKKHMNSNTHNWRPIEQTNKTNENKETNLKNTVQIIENHWKPFETTLNKQIENTFKTQTWGA